MTTGGKNTLDILDFYTFTALAAGLECRAYMIVIIGAMHKTMYYTSKLTQTDGLYQSISLLDGR